MAKRRSRGARAGRHRPVHRLARWQRATGIVPLALLSAAWTVALTTGGLASASSEQALAEPPGIPDVPTTPFEVPASVHVGTELPPGVDPHAGPDGTLSTLSSDGIPTAAVMAYQHAEMLLDQADASCNLEWPLVAAIGRVESNHGRYGGNVLGADGVASPGIYGVPLDGSGGTTHVGDTDDGAYDDDRVYDRAVGPMQFVPATWDVVGVDADGDGSKNPQDIDDAALATAVYLCAGAGDLSAPADARTAVYRYNNSTSYVDLVMKIAEAYANGDYTMVPNDTPSPVVLTDEDHDYEQPRQPADGRSAGGGPAGKDRAEPVDGADPGDGGTDGPVDGEEPGDDGDTGDNNDGGGGGGNNNDGGGGGGNNGGGGGGGGGGIVDDTEDTVEETTTPLEEATAYCREAMADAGMSPGQIADSLGTCTDAYLAGGQAAADAAIEGIVAALEDVLGPLPG